MPSEGGLSSVFNAPSNATEGNTTEPALADIISYSFYALTGAFMMCGNGLILWIVIRNKNLRKKEYIIPAGLAFGDFIYGLGNLSAGLKRLYLVLTGQDLQLVTAWYCMWEVFNFSFIFGCQMMTLMMVFVSIDRLIATSSVSTYMKLGVDYAIKGILLIAGYCAGSLVTAIVTSYYLPREEKHRRVCLTTWAVAVWYGDYHFFHQFTAGLVCICIYVAIIWTMKRDSAKIEHDQIKAEFKKRQLKVTKMLTFVISSGFFIHDLPNFMIFVVSYHRDYFGTSLSVWIPALWVIASLSSANNIIIYMVKNREIRSAALRILNIAWINSEVTPSEKSAPTQPRAAFGTGRRNVVGDGGPNAEVRRGSTMTRRGSRAVVHADVNHSRRGSMVDERMFRTKLPSIGDKRETHGNLAGPMDTRYPTRQPSTISIKTRWSPDPDPRH